MSDPIMHKVSTAPEDTHASRAPEIPEKFRTEDGGVDAQKVLDAYRNLESKLGSGEKIEIPDEVGGKEKPKAEPVTDADAEAKPDEKNEEFELDEADAAPVPVQEDGLPGTDEQRAEWGQHWVENGELSEDHYEQIRSVYGEQATKEVIDNYFRGLQAQQQSASRSVVDILGGEEQAQAIRDWSTEGLSPVQRKRFNDAMRSGDADAQAEALEGLRLRYEAARGRRGRNVRGGGNPSAARPFASRDEKLAAMADPRYKSSESYRAEVQARARAGGF